MCTPSWSGVYIGLSVCMKINPDSLLISTTDSLERTNRGSLEVATRYACSTSSPWPPSLVLSILRITLFIPFKTNQKLYEQIKLRHIMSWIHFLFKYIMWKYTNNIHCTYWRVFLANSCYTIYVHRTNAFAIYRKNDTFVQFIVNKSYFINQWNRFFLGS